MNKTLVVSSAIILVLLIVLAILYPKLLAANETAEKSAQLSASVKSFLSANDIRCTARSSDTLGLKECIDNQLKKNDFKVTTFDEFDTRNQRNGTIVIVNQGSKTYNGSNFLLTKNGIEYAKGCHITSNILPDYTCRFVITESCTVGDIFEVRYLSSNEPVRLVTKSC